MGESHLYIPLYTSQHQTSTAAGHCIPRWSYGVWDNALCHVCTQGGETGGESTRSSPSYVVVAAASHCCVGSSIGGLLEWKANQWRRWLGWGFSLVTHLARAILAISEIWGISGLHFGLELDLGSLEQNANGVNDSRMVALANGYGGWLIQELVFLLFLFPVD